MPPATAETARPSSGSFEKTNVALEKHKIIAAIEQFDTVTLEGRTGSGKSVDGPPAVLEGLKKLYPDRNVKMLIGQPRRFLAEGAAKIAASIANQPLGGDYVGYYHGGDSKKTDATQMVYTVNGSIRNQLQADITLSGYDAVFLDEVHLREIDQYAIRIGLRQAQIERAKKGMPPLKVILASADVTPRDGEYHGNSSHIMIEGKKGKNVEKMYVPQTIPLIDSPKEMARLAAEAIVNNTGDVFGFLPGRAEIIEAQKEFDRIMKEKGLSDTYKSGLFTGGGGGDNDQVQDMLVKGITDARKNPIAVFGTDVAETGANFKSIATVLDAGHSRVDVFDEQTGMTRLETRLASQAAIKQRLGRLGRSDREGLYIALYSQADGENLQLHPPEQPQAIVKSDLTQLVLSLKDMGLIDVYGLEYPDAPDNEKLDRAVKTLGLLGALKDDGSLSDDGKEIAKLPMDARFGKMIVEAKKKGCLEAASVLYGFLSTKNSVFTRRGDKLKTLYANASFIDTSSDFVSLLNVWNLYLGEKAKGTDMKQWAQTNGFNLEVLQDVGSVKMDLAEKKSLKDAGLRDEHSILNISAQKKAIEESVLAGFADKLLEKNADATFRFVDGGKSGIRIGRETGIIAATPYIITGDIRGGRTATDSLWAGMNQVVTEAQYKEITQKVEKINSQIEAQREKHAQTNRTGSEEIPIDHAKQQEGPSPEVQAILAATEAKAKAYIKAEKTDEEKLKEVRAEIHPHAATPVQSSHEQSTMHGENQKKEASLWADFKHSMARVGGFITYPIRKLWEWFAKLFGGKKSGGDTASHAPPAHH